MKTQKPNVNLLQKNYLEIRQNRVNSCLDRILPLANSEPQKLHQAMRYSVLNAGKRLRPILVYATGETFSASLDLLDIPAAAIELIHCFSLIHDDLPAMDNDDFRRGKPTCHKAFDEATAILVGDGLQALAPQLLADCEFFSAETKLTMVKCLTQRSWEMMLGQAIDLDAEINKNSTIAELEKMYLLKTGALISCALELGAFAAEITDVKMLTHLREFANCIGLAYQIQDDIFDIAESTKQSNPKITYPALIGIDAAKNKVTNLFKQAMDNLSSLNHDASLLISLAKYIMQRDY